MKTSNREAGCVVCDPSSHSLKGTHKEVKYSPEWKLCDPSGSHQRADMPTVTACLCVAGATVQIVPTAYSKNNLLFLEEIIFRGQSQI